MTVFGLVTCYLLSVAASRRAPLLTLGQWEVVSCQLCPTDQSVLLPSAPSMADRQCKQGLYSTTLVTIPTLGVYGCLGPHKAQSL